MKNTFVWLSHLAAYASQSITVKISSSLRSGPSCPLQAVWLEKNCQTSIKVAMVTHYEGEFIKSKLYTVSLIATWWGWTPYTSRVQGAQKWCMVGFWGLSGTFWWKHYQIKVAGHSQLRGGRSPFWTPIPDLEGPGPGVLLELKYSRIFSLLLEENLSLRHIKNNPIWSHWMQLTSLRVILGCTDCSYQKNYNF